MPLTAEVGLLATLVMVKAGAAVTQTVASVSPAPPVTRMGWQMEDGLLRVETVHTYPEEGRGVRSWTTFVRTEAGR